MKKKPVWWPRIYLRGSSLLLESDGPQGLLGLRIKFNPKDWLTFAEEHLYYDGPHCFYDFGPFGFYKSWGWCKKCDPYTEENNERVCIKCGNNIAHLPEEVQRCNAAECGSAPFKRRA